MKIRIKNYLLFLLMLVCTAAAGQTAGPTTPTRTLQLKRLADQYERQGRYDLAADTYLQLVTMNHRDITNYVGAKRNLIRLGELERLEQLIFTLQKKRRDIRYEIDLAEIEYRRGREKAALSHWQRIVDDNSRNHQVYHLIGQLYIEHRLMDKAISLFQKGRKSFKDNRLFVFELASIFESRSEYKKLTREYIDYVRNEPSQVAFIESRLAAVTTSPEIIREVTSTIEDALKKEPEKSSLLHKILAGIYTRSRMYDLAFTHVVAYENQVEAGKKAKTQKGRQLYDFATTAMNDGELEYAKRAFEHLLTHIGDSPLVISARLGLAGLLEQKGMYVEAISAYESVADKHAKSVQALQAVMRIGDLWFKKLGRIDNAEKAYGRILKEYPGNKLSIQARFRLAECALIRDDYRRALKTYREVRLKSKADRKKVLLAMAQLEFYHGKPSKALTHLQDFSERGSAPEDVENDALELLFLLQQNRGDSLGLAALGRAELLRFQKNYAEAGRTLESFLVEFPQSLLNEDMVLLLADLYRKQDRFDMAVRKLETLYNRENSLYRDFALHQMAQIYEKDLLDVNEAQIHYEKLLTQYPQSIFVEEARQRVRELDGKGNR